jgi:hypothetical protein
VHEIPLSRACHAYLAPVLLACAVGLPASSLAEMPADSSAIVAVMNKSAQDCNRGDLDAFATCYKNSPEILFMGSTLSRGYAQLLASYKRPMGRARSRAN